MGLLEGMLLGILSVDQILRDPLGSNAHLHTLCRKGKPLSAICVCSNQNEALPDVINL